MGQDLILLFLLLLLLIIFLILIFILLLLPGTRLALTTHLNDICEIPLYPAEIKTACRQDQQRRVQEAASIIAKRLA